MYHDLYGSPQTYAAAPDVQVRLTALQASHDTVDSCAQLRTLAKRHVVWRTCRRDTATWTEILVTRSTELVEGPVQLLTLLDDETLTLLQRSLAKRKLPRLVATAQLQGQEGGEERKSNETEEAQACVWEAPSSTPGVVMAHNTGTAARPWVWVTAADVLQNSHWFNAHFAEQVVHACKTVPALALPTNASTGGRMMVLYHGTSADAAVCITTARGFRPSTAGMLGGGGVYLGSFWKATRYAVWDATYGARPTTGCILRVLVHAQDARRVATFHRAGAVRAWAQSHPQLPPLHVACCMPSTALVSNEEWCVDPALCVVRHVGELDASTMDTARWNPQGRTALLKPAAPPSTACSP